MTSFDIAFQQVSKLANDFHVNLKFYMDSKYQEYEVRNHFINKFFIALGWDVLGDQNSNPYEQEVKVEKAQRQQGSRSQKRADYAFYKSPNFKDVEFFVEAKKPSVELKSIDNYFQTIRYGWNAQTPIAILTDFEQFHIIDCRIKPDSRYVFNGIHKEFRYTDYLIKEEFAKIYWLFSKEAVQSNSILKYSKDLPKPKGKVSQTTLFKIDTEPIDVSFLQYLDDIRENLAKAFKKNNNELDSFQLTEAVQRTIDRLVFIRFLEDKLIEGESHINEWRGWNDFVSDCRKLDAKYNGIVFKHHFIDDQQFGGAEEQLFKDICQDISSLNSPYDFNYIPIPILGSIYERFLGKVVIATSKRVHIDDKPEVRKAGGVFYTPQYIVKQIVENTVGKLIANKTPKQISKLKIADISCGSGSFLIGVYECLLDYHKKFYSEKFKGKSELDKRSEDFGNVEYRDGNWALTLKLKQQILLNNIFGIDIDSQAVEVSQLSLFLKMLEDESISTTSIVQGTMFSKVLPDLSKNIICGNSIIGFDILKISGDLFQSQELKGINPLDYSVKLPNIISDGGFDCIVGNPPYVNTTNSSPLEMQYFKINYKSTNDLFSIFIEKSLKLLKQNGKLGLIIPSLFIKGVRYSILRDHIIASFESFDIDEKGDGVFKGVQMPTCVILGEKNEDLKNKINFFNNPAELLFKKVQTIPLGSFSFIRRGLEIGKDKIIDSGYKKCITGSSIDSYLIKKESYVSKEIFYQFKKDLNIFNSPKLIIRETGDRFYSVVDNSSILTTRSLYNLQILNNYSVYFIQGILSSSLFTYYFKNFISPETKLFPKIRISQIKDIPIPLIDFNQKDIKKDYDEFIKIVEQLTILKNSAQGKTDFDKNYTSNMFLSLLNSIDEFVFKFYNLNETDIKKIKP